MVKEREGDSCQAWTFNKTLVPEEGKEKNMFTGVQNGMQMKATHAK